MTLKSLVDPLEIPPEMVPTMERWLSEEGDSTKWMARKTPLVTAYLDAKSFTEINERIRRAVKARRQ